jgi:hypothetical protein
MFDAVFYRSSVFEGNALQWVSGPTEPARRLMGGHEVRVSYSIKAKGDRLPSNLTVKTIEVLNLYVEEQYHGKSAPSEGGTVAVTTGSLATTNSTF